MVKNTTIWSYLGPFLDTKEYLHLADISKRLNKPHPTVRNYLNLFEEEGILIKETKGRLSLYKINPNSPILVDYLVLAEKEKLIIQCKNDLLMKEIVFFLHKSLNQDNKALIFGSAVINLKKANDVDILITGRLSFGDKIKEFEKKFNKKIHLINLKNLNMISESLRTEIIKKHLLIQGSEEIIKWLI